MTVSLTITTTTNNINNYYCYYVNLERFIIITNNNSYYHACFKVELLFIVRQTTKVSQRNARIHPV